MRLRPTQASIFHQVQTGIRGNTSRLIAAQLEVSSGRRIQRPSDDAAGASIALTLRRQMGALESFVTATQGSRPEVDLAAARLQDVSGLMTEARATILRGMDGALNEGDREILANQLQANLDQLMVLANSQSGDNYLFGGTATDRTPYTIDEETGRVVYNGDSGRQRVLVGREAPLDINIPGDEIFSSIDGTGTILGTMTGVTGGIRGNTGTGYDYLHVRSDGTIASLGQGVTLANGGADDTFLGNYTLTFDGPNSTVSVDGGPPVTIPTPFPADFELEIGGGEMFLDLSGWNGASFTGTVGGTASVSLDQVNYVPITFTEIGLRVQDSITGNEVNIDTTQIDAPGYELITFEGSASIFDTLQGAIEDLRNDFDIDIGQVVERLGTRLTEFDRVQGDVLVALGKLGGASRRITESESRLQDLQVNVQGLISNVEDSDFAEAVLELTRSEQTLQLAQATGSRVIQQTLLNFLQ